VTDLDPAPATPVEGGRVLLLRHGETEWSAGGKHTSRTDIPLTERGRQRARETGKLGALLLDGHAPALVLSSPRVRALTTAELAGLHVDRTDDRLVEWDYGNYEGLTTPEIRRDRPGWTVWRDGPAGGETVGEVGVRVDRVIARARAGEGDTLAFAHGHVLRILAARWLDQPPSEGRLFVLSTATVSVLGWEREQAVFQRWNDVAD
jgi:broad specificity phosphatase PhoE